MASDLLDASEVFAARLRRCADAIESHVDWSVEDVLRQRPGAPSLDRVEIVQPVLFAVHVALAEMWLADGLVVDAVVGQSQGEIAAACVAGAISLEDAARIIVVRSQLFAEELVGRGGIASIGLPECEILSHLTAFEGRLDIAGIIGSRTVTVAGEMAALKELVAQLNQQGISATVVPASIPSHCAFIDPLREELANRLGEVRPRQGHIPMYSTVTAQQVRADELTTDYWYANARRPVLFDPAVRVLLGQGHQVFVEASAHPVLTRAMSDTAADLGCPVVITGTLRRGCGGADQFRIARAAVWPQHATPVHAAA